MNILKKYLSRSNASNPISEKRINYVVTSQEQIDFANGAIEIFNPVLRQFGFNLFKLEITEYGTSIIWIKDKCYIDFSGNTHPHDAPAYYGIALGEFKEEYFHYADLDCVGLWRLKAIQENIDNVNDTPFPFGADIQLSLLKTMEELLKYGKSFLQGDLTDFYIARKQEWKQLSE